jgi:hypothetical protein
LIVYNLRLGNIKLSSSGNFDFLRDATLSR